MLGSRSHTCPEEKTYSSVRDRFVGRADLFNDRVCVNNNG